MKCIDFKKKKRVSICFEIILAAMLIRNMLCKKCISTKTFKNWEWLHNNVNNVNAASRNAKLNCNFAIERVFLQYTMQYVAYNMYNIYNHL